MVVLPVRFPPTAVWTEVSSEIAAVVVIIAVVVIVPIVMVVSIVVREVSIVVVGSGQGISVTEGPPGKQDSRPGNWELYCGF